MKLSLAAAALPLALGASTVNLRVARDATVSYNGIMCSYDTVPCNAIPFGLQNKVTTFRGNRDFSRVLLGFDLPTNKPTKCVLRVPKPVDNNGPSAPGFALTVSNTDNVWDEASVCGYNKKIDGTVVGSVNVTAPQETGSVDVTAACTNATNYKISLFVDTSFPLIAFNSLQSGHKDVFTLDYTF
ncbi:hypothetical protein IWW57_000293 [Coemansia sp. S610]|uniref:Ubiquitin 3 binding protein But2 C-terminal domain-containing protein n=1 Tax=Coemansia spiralis TaxID=417178 RepID=A0A9W8L6M3_9FUNG|nr:hypothetical protein IWW57_000293 [Coemansia sp. S610]KAJ2380233.1 hypothetical protein H4S02_006785 [Coemansia sp. RSA 2611]KAJ2689673.1 hypothetical protein IWW39_001265 [Coemansia spiralis]